MGEERIFLFLMSATNFVNSSSMVPRPELLKVGFVHSLIA